MRQEIFKQLQERRNGTLDASRYVQLMVGTEEDIVRGVIQPTNGKLILESFNLPSTFDGFATTQEALAF